MLEVEGLGFAYGKRPVLENVCFRAAAGELCSILGNNGAGKSTMLKCLVGILSPQRGSVLVKGDDAVSLSRKEVALRMAYVAQRGDAPPGMTVFDAVLMGRRPHITWGVTGHDLRVVEEVMDSLQLEGLALRYLDELSGGELQKVVMARALAQEPAVLLLDEPTSNLDLKNQLEVMRTVKRAVGERGIAAVMAIHDINLALRFSDRFMLLEGGSILACGGSEVIQPESIARTYGIRVSIERVDGRRMVIPE